MLQIIGTLLSAIFQLIGAFLGELLELIPIVKAFNDMKTEVIASFFGVPVLIISLLAFLFSVIKLVKKLTTK